MKAHRNISSKSFELTIDKVIYGGEGLGRHGGKVVFVPFTAPGDQVEARVVEEKRNFARASFVKLVEPAPGRQVAPCPHFGRCGGCQWQHIEYARQVELKRQILEEMFHHSLPESREMEVTMIGSPEAYGYRSRARLQLQGFGHQAKIGFFQFHSHRVEDVEFCPLLHPVLNEALNSIREARHGEVSDPGVRQIDIACSSGEKRWQSAPVIAGLDEGEAALPSREAAMADPVILQRRVGEFSYWVSPSAFFQANDYLVGRLVQTVFGLASGAGSKLALDLFSGVGLFSLPLARQFESVVAVESSPLAWRLCAKNVEDAGLNNVQAVRAEVSAWMKAMSSIAPPAFDLVILDPPRTGVPQEVMNRLVEWVPEVILYVSCDPKTLIRDLAVVSPRYYRIDFIQGFDFFPQTYHFETIVRLQRR